MKLASPDGSERPLYVYGITRRNVDRLIAGNALTIDNATLGGEDNIVIAYGENAKELFERFAGSFPNPEDRAKFTALMDQFAAMEAEAGP
jgi:hypothetical protein